MSVPFDVTADIWHRDGIPWHDAPVPPAKHRCFVQSSGWIGLNQWLRCACGAFAEGIDLKVTEGRAYFDDDVVWNRLWRKRNSRGHPDEPVDPIPLAGIDRRGRDWTTIGLLFILGLLVAFLVFSAGWWMARQAPVCHARTEDSVVVDCDYRDRGWYQE